LKSAGLNIPVFAPGSGPPALGGRKESNTSESGEGNAAAADSSSTSSSSTATRAPGKLKSNALMSNLNSMLGGGPPKRQTSEEGANGNESKPAADESKSESPEQDGAAAENTEAEAAAATPAPITHARRAKVVRRGGRTTASQLQKAGVLAKKGFQEIKVESVGVGIKPKAKARITIVEAPKPKVEEQPATEETGNQTAATEEKPEQVSSDSAATAKASEPAPIAVPSEDVPAAAAQSAGVDVPAGNSASTDSSSTAAPVESAAHASSTSTADSAAASSSTGDAAPAPAPAPAAAPAADPYMAYDPAAALYGAYEPPAFDENKADEYRAVAAAGCEFLKHGKSGKPHSRLIFVTPSLHLYFVDPKDKSKLDKGNYKPDPKNGLDLNLVSKPKMKVLKGKTTSNFQRSTAKNVEEDVCLSITGARNQLGEKRDLDLQAKNKEERDLWHETISFMLHEAQLKREQALLTGALA